LNGICEFARRREGMIYALDGGMWFHRHSYNGEPMAHVVSSDKELLLRFGEEIGMLPEWLQYKRLRDPRTGKRVEAWHWDLRRWSLEAGLRMVESKVE
jgi:hypothetical protein